MALMMATRVCVHSSILLATMGALVLLSHLTKGKIPSTDWGEMIVTLEYVQQGQCLHGMSTQRRNATRNLTPNTHWRL